MRLAPHMLAEQATQDLLPARQFARALQRERQRCDRCGTDLALIRLELSGPAGGTDPQLEPVLGSILERVRATDELGWLAPGVLGLLLPGTDGVGAWTVVDDLRSLTTPALPQGFRIGVYCYGEPRVEGSRPARAAPRVRLEAEPVG